VVAAHVQTIAEPDLLAHQERRWHHRQRVRDHVGGQQLPAGGNPFVQRRQMRAYRRLRRDDIVDQQR